jgi:hypothetical protein
MIKAIRYCVGITLIIIFLGFVYAVLNKAQAETHPVFPPGVMQQQQIPIFCGPGPLVFSYASSTFKQKPIAWSDVLNNGSVFLTIQSSGETCLMGYGMDWIFDTELLLDIVNDSFANGSKLPDEVE